MPLTNQFPTYVHICMSLFVVFSVARATSSAAPMSPVIEIGFLEEHYYGADVFGESVDNPYRNVVRVAFAWDSGKWSSFEQVFAEKRAANAPCLQLWKMRNWKFKRTDGDTVELVSAGTASVPLSSHETVQLVLHSDKPIWMDSDLRANISWLEHPLRLPKVLTTGESYPSSECQSATPVELSELPEAVLVQLAAYMQREILPAETSAATVRRVDAVTSVMEFNVTGNEILYRIGLFETTESLPDSWRLPIQNPVFVGFHRKSRNAQFIGDGLTFLMCHDFNATGTPEVLFWIDRYNENGYLLTYDNFTGSVSYRWSYH